MNLRFELETRLEAINLAFEISRKLKISSARAISAIHDKRKSELDEELKRKLDMLIEKNPSILSSASSQILLAYQEYAEAKILSSIIDEDVIPEIDIPPESFLTGLGDVTGELKRKFLEELLSGNKKEAKRLLNHGLRIHDILSEHDYPDYLVRGFRRKKDQTRYQVNSMLEIIANHSGKM